MRKYLTGGLAKRVSPSGTPNIINLIYLTMTPISEAYNIDCMDYMRTIPDGYFDLAVVDPPYGGANSGAGGGATLRRLV